MYVLMPVVVTYIAGMVMCPGTMRVKHLEKGGRNTVRQVVTKIGQGGSSRKGIEVRNDRL